MPSIDREGSRDRDTVAKHQHSNSDSGRSPVPMWDSSDPDRAPPPLPLNPSSLEISPTRPNTSANVAAAARALTERAREGLRDNFGPSPYAINPRTDRSPEKSPTRSAQNKRLQSLQNGGAKDFRSALENLRSPSPEKSISRPSTPDWLSSSPDRNITPTPSSRDVSKDKSQLRTPSRAPLKPILGENAPTSSTVQAMRAMVVRDEPSAAPLSDVTNSSLVKVQQPYDGIYQQMVNLTSIATKLQSDMVKLSHRSESNASDLGTLKLATRQRDEDIRATLQDLVKTAKGTQITFGSPRLMDRHDSPTFSKSVSLPRIPPFNHNIDDDRAGSPSLYSTEGAASIAMLEKIIREMVTKEGQERLLSALTEMMEKSGRESSMTMRKVEGLVDFIREKPSQALVRHKGSVGDGPPKLELDFNTPQPLALARSMGQESPRANAAKQGDRSATASSIVSDDLLKVLQKIKDSISQSGGLTSEVKALVRELRGEVLVMGRQLGRKLDDQVSPKGQKAVAGNGVSREELTRIVQEGLSELREHMDRVIHSKRRQSSGSAASRNTVDSQEVFAVVQHALAERGLNKTQVMPRSGGNIDREAIFAAVKEAYEEYKPEIELQQFGLERDEILECLRDGLEDYRSSAGPAATSGISKEEIIDTMREAMQHFQPPKHVSEAAEIKEEVLAAVRESLENFHPQPQPARSWHPGDVSREDIMDAVRESMAAHKKEGAREIDINREDLFHAVQAGLDNTKTPFGGYGDQVLKSLHEIVEGMRVEFKQYSAANGRDTEQVLDAVKDGLEELRAHIESYTVQGRDITGKGEKIDALKAELQSLRGNFEEYLSQMPRSDNVLDRSDVIDYLKAEFEHMHEAINSHSSAKHADSHHKEEILVALASGFAGLKAGGVARGLDGEQNEETLDAMKEEFDQLRETVLTGSAAHKDEIIESIQDSLSGIHSKIGSTVPGSESTQDILGAIREEFNALKETIAAPVPRSASVEDKDAVLEVVRESLDGIRTQLAADQNESASESLGAIREELDNLRLAIGGSIVGSSNGAEKEEILNAIRSTLDGVYVNPATLQRAASSAEAFETVRGELEHLRQSIAGILVKGGAQTNNEEVLDAVRLGLDDLRSHVEMKLDSPERSTAATGEMLDALNEGLETLRNDIAKANDKPADMTVSYEILDALKDGLNGVREDISRLKFDKAPLKMGEVVLADPSAPDSDSIDVRGGVPSGLKKNDLDKLEVMLAHLQIKVEAMDQNIQSAPQIPGATPFAEDGLKKEDLGTLEAILGELQDKVADLIARERSSDSAGGVASKEDTDAIETLLLNTKAKLEEMVTKDDLDTVEVVVRMTNESVEGLVSKIESNGASKDDMAALEILLHETKSTLKDLGTKFADAASSDEKVVKSDIEDLETLCTQIKQRMRELPGESELPSKADFEQVACLLEDLRHGQDKLRHRYETDIEVTAKAFDDRKDEAKLILDQMAELKSLVEASKDELKARMKRGTQDVRAIDEILQGIEDKIDLAPNSVAEVAELMEIVKDEFERAHALSEDNERKHDEAKKSMVAEITDKLDERVNALMMRHDESQRTTEQAANLVTERAVEQNELIAGSRAIADDLKLTIETLGSTVTGIAPALAEATDKMSDDAKTVFNRVDEVHSRVDDCHQDNKNEHQLTRDEVIRTLTAIGSLQAEITDFHPQFMQTLKDVLLVVGDHYEHSKGFQEQSRAQTEAIKTSFASFPVPNADAPMLPAPRGFSEDSKVHSKLDELLERDDTTSLNSKLDEVLGHARSSKQSLPGSGIEKIEEIHEQIKAATTELSAFVAFQTKMISAEHDSKEKEANQAALDLSRCLNEKEDLEAVVNELAKTKTDLSGEVADLKIERDGLAVKKTRLTGEVSSLETALNLRREELHMMDARADALERRIIEGVMDHSRALLLSKTSRGGPNMDLKRVASNVSSSTQNTTVPSSAVSAGLGIALKSRSKAATPRNTTPSHPTARRIMSLGQISGNRASGGHVLAAAPSGGLGNLKRSHTLKTPIARKGSLPARRTVSDFDKENDILTESDNENEDAPRGNEIVPYEGDAAYDSGAVFEGVTPSMERRSSLGTGSYFTGTESDRRTSNDSTIRSTLGIGTSLANSIHEDEEDSAEDEYENDEDDQRSQTNEDAGEQALVLASAQQEDVKRGTDAERRYESDSGLGTDLPTAALSHTMGSDLFRVSEAHV